MVDLADRAPGVSAFVADGAFRGTHIVTPSRGTLRIGTNPNDSLARVQSETGCPVISPARRKSKERGGILIGKYGHAAAQLPPSRARTARIEECGGHVLYAAGGTIYERSLPPAETSTSWRSHDARPKETASQMERGRSTPGTP